METATERKSQKINWLSLISKIQDWQQSQRGWVSELKRIKSPEDIADYPAYYRLVQGNLTPGRVAERIAFLLPWLPHQENAPPLGEQLKKAGISEMRLFQVLRAEPPNDLVLLRRLIQQAKPTVDWTQFGITMQYWGQIQKRKLLEQYFLNTSQQETKE